MQWIEGGTSAEMRERYLHEAFLPMAARAFAEDADVQSVVLAIGQYWCDEAVDAVHLALVPSAERDPTWPAIFSDSPFYELTEHDGVVWEGSTPKGDAILRYDWYADYPQLDENQTSITAFASCCHEVTSQEDPLAITSRPYAIARRGDRGPELEIVGRVLRPEWEDRFDVGFDADDAVPEAPDEPPPPPRRPGFLGRLFGRG